AFPWFLEALDVVDLALRRGTAVEEAAVVHFALAERLLLDNLRDRIGALTRLDRWQTAARASLRADFWESHRALTDAVLATTDAGLPASVRVEAWAAAHAGVVRRYRRVVDDVEAGGEYDLTTLTVVTR